MFTQVMPAHDIPGDVTVQAFLKPEGRHLRLLVRVSLKAMRDMVFPEDDRGYLDVAPELIVEILSPDDRALEVTQKLRDYFSIGVRLVWVIDPDQRIVYAYRSLTDVRAFTESDTLTAEEVLPEFAVPVANLFEV